MTGFDLADASAPWVVLVPHGSAEVRRQLSRLVAGGGLLHRLPADGLTTAQDVFRTFAATLRFPGCFGRNRDALVDCLGDLCGEVTGGGAGMAGVVRGADRLPAADHFPLFVSVLCQGADRAAQAGVAEHFVLEFREFDRESIASRIEQPDLSVTTGDGFVAAALDPDVWN
ncbi:barstar family protein [Streptomyces sp. NPDC101234]|uniref:barstar family protein n=1 Tax=Streptomyces sp. NPDC101234 TaxID=3366138 RepID=UPI00380527F5